MNRKVYLVNNIECHCSITGGIMISEDGKTIALNNYGKVGDELTIQNDASGPYVINRLGKRIDVGYAVAEAWLNAYPGDGPKKAERIDGNIMNCAASNLKWMPDFDAITPDTGGFLKRVNMLGQDVVVYRTGKVMLGSLELDIKDSYHDEATDCERFLFKPYASSGKTQLPMDDLMAYAGFVSGSPAGMKCPKVLHINYDVMDFNASNLVWAEFSSPDFQNYLSAVIETNLAKSAVANAGKIVPDNWFRIPFCPKEYFNYKASGMFGHKKP